MTTGAVAALAVAGVAAAADWAAVAAGNKRVEYVAKPLAMAALVAVAVALDPSDESRRTWFVLAGVLSLAGDVFLMLPRDRFVAGLVSVLTVMGLTISGIMSGQIILENMFNIPGVGQFLFSRLLQRDFPPFQGTVFLIATVVVTMNLLVDILYAWLDPRIRYS